MSGPDFALDPAALKAGERLFRGECNFAAGATSPAVMPPEDLPEIAFAGRSNVGKSSLINALTGRRALARSSKTPGRTQQINFFDLGGAAYLVDFPGHGFAAASKEKINAWTGLIRAYLRNRRVLRRVCLLIDARHGFKIVDEEAMRDMDAIGVPYLVVLTKCDKVKPAELTQTVAFMHAQMKYFTAAYPKIYETSSDTKGGIAELRAFLAAEVARG